MNRHDRLLYLFDRLPVQKQQDLMNLLETWNAVPSLSVVDENSELNPALEDSIGREWHCLNALKKVVSTHFPPRLELAYVAFHPYLDSVSSAKSRRAAEQMYTLEAAYELKRIYENDPESDVFTAEVTEQLHRMLHDCSVPNPEQK
ncbi:hypothetical protein [Tumebacillus flagellatus]|uniref:Uncharacterized protein n=1 Tax=Tumebacillus flagellatus TaxID=1157490 RepID=A0A074LJK7_9BACL|nr:hypothetical protein [Tumebacillus flagellatus]KEO81284.1 hypothetical protein EL26_21640 [Tumebacillus flagellatus]